MYNEASDFMCLSLLILSVPQLLVLLSINIHKHFRKKFYTIITTAPSPFIFIVNIKGSIRAHFGSRGEAISTVSQQESEAAFIL